MRSHIILPNSDLFTVQCVMRHPVTAATTQAVASNHARFKQNASRLFDWQMCHCDKGTSAPISTLHLFFIYFSHIWMCCDKTFLCSHYQDTVFVDVCREEENSVGCARVLAWGKIWHTLYLLFLVASHSPFYPQTLFSNARQYIAGNKGVTLIFLPYFC